MTSPRPQAVVSPMDWPAFLATFGGQPPAMFADFRAVRASQPYRAATGSSASPSATASTSDAEPASADFRRQLADLPANRRRPHLKGVVNRDAAKVLGMHGNQQIDPDRPLQELGLDSLMAIELRNQLGKTAGEQFPSTLLFDYPTVNALTGFILAQLQLDQPDPSGPTPESAPADPDDLDSLLSGIENMSGDEIAKLLEQQVKGS
jgi:acyl carrier protein